MADISNVINVSLIPEGQLATTDNMNVVAILSSEIVPGVLDTANRFQLYSNAAAVAADHGSDSQANAYAEVFFSQQPNPINAGGVLVVGFYRAAQESVAASSAILTGAQVAEAVAIPQLQEISDGSFDIDVDGGTVSVSAIDTRVVTTLEEVAALLDTAIAGASVEVVDQKFIITSDTDGVTSLMDFAEAAVGGTFLGEILNIGAGTGAATVQGADASVLALETPVAAATALLAEVNYKGFMFIDNPIDADSKLLASFAQANNVLSYDVFSVAANLLVDETNVVWDIKLSGLTNYRMLFSAANNRKLAAGYMARAHVVNFAAENSALTMQLKEIKGVAAESYSQTDITAAKTVGLDIYTTIKNVPIVLTSGANDFMDNRYNIIAFIDSQQTAGFNHLKQTGTKIPQTTPGVNSLVDALEKDARAFVKAGVFAPGTWSSPDRFGDADTFDRNIEQFGFYYLAGLLSDQSQVDRQDRKSPVIQGAVKNAGAIHSADIVINFNR